MKTIKINQEDISISAIYKLRKKSAKVELDTASQYVEHINQGSQFLDSLLDLEGEVYGVTTGFGDSCDVGIDSELAQNLSQQLYRFHGCGTGKNLSCAQGKMVLAVRLASLAKGWSGVRYALLQQLAAFINLNIIPVIPSEGSVGASGDLTPLSYVAATLCGEREVYYQGKIIAAIDALKAEGLSPLSLKPKEGLALMNGTAVMTALAIEAYFRYEYLCRLSCRISAQNALALGSNIDHFNENLFALKAHAGQQLAALRMREDIGKGKFFSGRLQERYSIRCAPHVIGVAMDALDVFAQHLHNELNSVNDNPIIDYANHKILHGGHFYGGHIAWVMDSMKNLTANIADLLDRQLALLVDGKYNYGLPRNLSASQTSNCHGFKAIQIAASAWTAEALKLTMPASVFSRSTESHNQDKVSMGTIAARDALRVLELLAQVAAVTFMAAQQALKLRAYNGELAIAKLSLGVQQSMQELEKYFDFLKTDSALDSTILAVKSAIIKRKFSLYEVADEQ